MKPSACNDTLTRVLLFIPVYQCDIQVIRILASLEKSKYSFIDKILLVDNLSTDNTLHSIVRYVKDSENLPSCSVICNKTNYGLGGSHKVAAGYAMQHGYSHIIVLHGDDQADLADIEETIALGDHLFYDCILGARFMKGSRLIGYSLGRRLANNILNYLFSSVVMNRVWDLGSGLNLFTTNALITTNLDKLPDDLTFNYALMLELYRNKRTIKYIPISWRDEDQVSNLRLAKQAMSTIKILAKYIFRARSTDSYNIHQILARYEYQIVLERQNHS